MPRDDAPIPFFTDNDVPASVNKALLAAGHTVVRLRDQMALTSPDEIVATACREGGLVLVTHNVRDFQRILRDRMQMTKKQALQFSRLELACSQVEAARRVQEEMEVIELAWARHRAEQKVGMSVTIARDFVRIEKGPERIRPKRQQARPGLVDAALSRR